MQAGLSPEAKRAALDQYRQRYEVVAMVGDGLNDGPVLADADVGIAVGSATDLARETASLVLPKDGLWMLPWVIAVARAVRKTIVTNLMWAFGYNLVALTLAALGMLQPVLAAAIMASSSLLLVVNSLRLSRLPDPAPLAIPERPPSAGAGQRAPWSRRSSNGWFRDRAGLKLEHRSAEHIVGECDVPAVRRLHDLATGLGVFTYLTDQDFADLDRPTRGLQGDGVAHRIVGGKKREAGVEQMRGETLRPGERRGDGEGADLGLAIGEKGGFRHVAAAGCIADDVDSGLELRLEGRWLDRTPA